MACGDQQKSEEGGPSGMPDTCEIKCAGVGGWCREECTHLKATMEAAPMMRPLMPALIIALAL